MQAVIIAAGESSRFWPVNHQHKCQIQVLGKPLVYWTIKNLSDKGIKDIILVINPESCLKDRNDIFQDLNVNLSFVIQEKPLGTGNAVFSAKNLIKGPFFVVWPYKVIAGEIAEKVLEKYKETKAQIILVGNKTTTPWDYGVLKYEEDKAIEIVEKPKPGEEPSDVKVLGFYFLEPDFFKYYSALKEHHHQDFVDALSNYIKEKKASFISWDKEVPTLKYPWALLELMDIKFRLSDFKSYISSTASVGKNVVLNGDVHIGDNVVIGDNTVISGPCYIGDNCKIGASNVFRGPLSLEKDVVTGAFTEIKHSVIQEGTHFHSGYLGDSIIGKNCRFGAGFIAGNRKIDRENIKSVVKGNKIDTGLTYFGCVIGNNTRVGIHSGTMPGVLIGASCLVGPSTFVFENIEDSTKYYTEFNSVKKG